MSGDCTRCQEAMNERKEREAALSEVRSTFLLGSIQFRNIITWLKNTGRRASAGWLVKQIQRGSVREALDYVDGCHVCPTSDGGLIEPNTITEAIHDVFGGGE